MKWVNDTVYFLLLKAMISYRQELKCVYSLLLITLHSCRFSKKVFLSHGSSLSLKNCSHCILGSQMTLFSSSEVTESVYVWLVQPSLDKGPLYPSNPFMFPEQLWFPSFYNYI